MAEAPPGRLEQEALLVEYKLLNADRPAALRLTLMDLPEAAPVESYLAAALPSAEGWQRAGKTEPVEVQGRQGTRITFTLRQDKGQTIREVVAFRRGERVYFFTGVFDTSDTNARQQIRRVVESVEWKG